MPIIISIIISIIIIIVILIMLYYTILYYTNISYIYVYTCMYIYIYIVLWVDSLIQTLCILYLFYWLYYPMYLFAQISKTLPVPILDWAQASAWYKSLMTSKNGLWPFQSPWLVCILWTSAVKCRIRKNVNCLPYAGKQGMSLWAQAFKMVFPQAVWVPECSLIGSMGAPWCTLITSLVKCR